jgi:hypothetical protein
VLDAARDHEQLAFGELHVTRSWIVSRPLSTRKKSSVSSCLCHTNAPIEIRRALKTLESAVNDYIHNARLTPAAQNSSQPHDFRPPSRTICAVGR